MLFKKQKSQLGIDIGTSNIKLVELKPTDKTYTLETYGIANVSFNLTGKDSAGSINHTASVLKELMKRSGVTSNKAVASLPNSSVFTSLIELPKIPQNELKRAIEFEAKKYVPLPLEEVALSWSALEEKPLKITKDTNLGNFKQDTSKQKILLTAVPTVVIDNYLKIFQAAGIQPEALEIEALALIRSILSRNSDANIVIDIGAKSTSINLVNNGYLRLSKSLTVGGDTISNSLAQSLTVNFARAEQFKKDFGMNASGQQIPQVMRPILDIIKNETTQLINIFEVSGERIQKIFLTGGGSKLPGLVDYFSVLEKKVELAQPWSNVRYSAQLKPVIAPLGLNLAVAIGLAMRPT